MAEERKTIGDRLRDLRKKKGGIIGGILLTTGFGYFLLTTGLGDGLVTKSYDLPFGWRPFIHPTEVVMVYLDDASHKHLGLKYLEPWPRSYYTKLLNRLTAEKAKAVVFDIIFSDPRDPVTDKQFADAITANGNVVLATDWVLEDYGGNEGRKAGFFGPDKLFSEAAADLGSTAIFPDTDMCIRRYMPQVVDETGKTLKYSSEAWAAVELIGAPATTDKTRGQKPIWLNYYGPTDILPGVSLYQAIADHDPSVPTGFFSNKVVFVGARYQTQHHAAQKDDYASPFSDLQNNKFMPGVTIQATACLNLIRGDWLRRFSFSTERLIIVGFGFLFGFGFLCCRPLLAILIALVSGILIVAMSYGLFAFHYYWFPWLVVAAGQIPIALIWALACHATPSRKANPSSTAVDFNS